MGGVRQQAREDVPLLILVFPRLVIAPPLLGEAHGQLDDLVLALRQEGGVEVEQVVGLLVLEVDSHFRLLLQVLQVVDQIWLVEIHECVSILVDSRLHNLEALLVSVIHKKLLVFLLEKPLIGKIFPELIIQVLFNVIDGRLDLTGIQIIV